MLVKKVDLVWLIFSNHIFHVVSCRLALRQFQFDFHFMQFRFSRSFSQAFVSVLTFTLATAYCKTMYTGTRKNKTRNTGGTAEHPRTKAKQLNIARNTSRTLRNTNGKPVEHLVTMEPYNTKYNCSSIFKAKFKPQRFKLSTQV